MWKISSWKFSKSERKMLFDWHPGCHQISNFNFGVTLVTHMCHLLNTVFEKSWEEYLFLTNNFFLTNNSKNKSFENKVRSFSRYLFPFWVFKNISFTWKGGIIALSPKKICLPPPPHIFGHFGGKRPKWEKNSN